MSGIHLHIIAEGQTEQQFVLKVLAPHLAHYHVYADARCILTSKDKHTGRQSRGGPGQLSDNALTSLNNRLRKLLLKLVKVHRIAHSTILTFGFGHTIRKQLTNTSNVVLR